MYFYFYLFIFYFLKKKFTRERSNLLTQLPNMKGKGRIYEILLKWPSKSNPKSNNKTQEEIS